MRKKIIFGFILVVIGVLVFMLLQKPKKISIAVLPKSYVKVLDLEEGASLEVSFYVNQDQSFVTQFEKIETAYLHDKDLGNQFRLACKKIQKISKNEIKNQEYFEYLYVFDFGYTFHDSVEIKDCYLTIHYKTGQEVEIFLGRFAQYRAFSDLSSDISVSRIKGVVSEIDHKKYLVGIALKLSSSKSGKITNVSFYHPLIDLSDVKRVDYETLESQTDPSSILGYSYKWDEEMIEEVNLSLNQETELYLSLSYEKLDDVRELGFMVTYEIEGEIHEFVYKPFVFFMNHEEVIYINEMDFYTYEFD